MYICVRYQYKNNPDALPPSWDYPQLHEKWKWFAGRYSANNTNNGTANNGTANDGTSNDGTSNDGTATYGTANYGTANYEWFRGPDWVSADVIEYLRGRFVELINEGYIENFEITNDKPPLG